MIDKLWIFEGLGTDPYINLATEQYLLEHLQAGEYILYLWQNQNTVVIGKNQNAWVECRVSLLQQEGGRLARRLSGGGAVFHDLGNLNFTFLTKEENYDVDKQLSVIAKACEMSGICVEKSGRNDLVTGGRKFSGNAFYHAQDNAYHHGTLLIAADLEKLQRYLSPSKAKLEAKGVSSVRSRVVNLSELSPGLTVDTMRRNMKRAFADVFGYGVEPMTLSAEAREEIHALAQVNGSWEYLFGSPLPFSFSCEARFSWGGILLELDARDGIIQSARVYSDAMDWHLPKIIESALTGSRFDKKHMQDRLQASVADHGICSDLCALIEKQDI